MAYNVDFTPVQMASMQNAEMLKDMGYAIGSAGSMAVDAGLTGLLGKTFKPEFEGSKRAWSDKIIKNMWETELQDHPGMDVFKDYDDFYKTMSPQFEADDKGKVQFKSRTGRDGMVDRLTDWLGTSNEADITAAQDAIWNRLEDPELHKKFFNEYKRYDEATSPRVMRGLLGAPGSKDSGLLMPLFDKEFWQSGISGARKGQYAGRDEDLSDFELHEEDWKKINPDWQSMDEKAQRKSFQRYIDVWKGEDDTKLQSTGQSPKLDDLDWTIGEDGDFQVNNDPGGLMNKIQGFRTGWDAMNDSDPGHEVPWWRKPAQQTIGAITGSAALGGGFGLDNLLKGAVSGAKGAGLYYGAKKGIEEYKEGTFERWHDDAKAQEKEDYAKLNKKLFPNMAKHKGGQDLEKNLKFWYKQEMIKKEAQTKWPEPKFGMFGREDGKMPSIFRPKRRDYQEYKDAYLQSGKYKPPTTDDTHGPPEGPYSQSAEGTPPMDFQAWKEKVADDKLWNRKNEKWNRQVKKDAKITAKQDAANDRVEQRKLSRRTSKADRALLKAKKARNNQKNKFTDSLREVTDVSTGTKTYIPKGVSRKRYGKFLTYRENGGELGWEQFKSRRMFRPEFESLWNKRYSSPTETSGPSNDLGPAYDPNQVKPDDASDTSAATKPNDLNMASQFKAIKDTIQPTPGVKDSSDMGGAQWNHNVWGDTIKEDYGKDSADQMTWEEEADLMYKVGVDGYKSGGPDSGNYKWENWSVFNEWDKNGRGRFEQAKTEIDNNFESFIQKHNIPLNAVSAFIERFGGLTEQAKTAMAIVFAESRFQKSTNTPATPEKVIDKSNNTKKSTEILNKAKKKKKATYNPNREASTPRRQY